MAEVISKVIASAMNAVGDKPVKAIIEGEKNRYEIVWEGGEIKIKLNGRRQ